MKKAFVVGIASLCFVLSGSVVQAQDYHWIVRGRLISVSPDDSSGTIADTGTGVSVDSAIVPEVDFTYLFNPHWGLEVIAATSKHDLSTTGGAIGGLDAGSVWVLPPTITLQYRLDMSPSSQLYFGLGLNYTVFYSYDLSSDLAGAGVSDIGFDNSFGLAGQVGVDIGLSDRWILNLDVKYIDISTDAELKLAAGGTLDTVSVDINPWVFGVGVGYRF